MFGTDKRFRAQQKTLRGGKEDVPGAVPRGTNAAALGRDESQFNVMCFIFSLSHKQEKYKQVLHLPTYLKLLFILYNTTLIIFAGGERRTHVPCSRPRVVGTRVSRFIERERGREREKAHFHTDLSRTGHVEKYVTKNIFIWSIGIYIILYN